MTAGRSPIISRVENTGDSWIIAETQTIEEQVFLFVLLFLELFLDPMGLGSRALRMGLQPIAGISEERWWNWFSKSWKNYIHPLLKGLSLLGWRSVGVMKTRETGKNKSLVPPLALSPLASLIGAAYWPSSWQSRNVVCRVPAPALQSREVRVWPARQ